MLVKPWPAVEDEPMRWEALFADLEAQLAAADAAELDAEVVERTRYEVGRLRVVDRLRPLIGADMTFTVQGVGALPGTLLQVGADWLLLGEEAGTEALVPLAAVSSAAGLSAHASEPGSEGPVAARLDLRYAVRGLVRDRRGVVIGLTDGRSLTGTPDRVGADYVEVAEHAAGESRRPAAVRRTVAVPLAALAVIRSASG